jgi:zinc transport system ATP-binding protein
MTIPALEIKDLSFSFDKTPLLYDISLSVLENQFIAMIGPNGSGKTTLLKLMLGFLKPLHGSVKLFNKPPEKAHRSIGYVPQVNIYDQKFPLSVFDVVLMGSLSKLTWYGAYPQSVKDKAMEALKLVGLGDMHHRAFGTLSGGQAQRALIARAIIDDPKILFLDEPTANIDIETQVLILKLLLKLKSSMTIIMVTHHLQSFVQYIDKVFCIQNTLTEFNPEQICEHFALGVFHSPLINIKGGKS